MVFDQLAKLLEPCLPEDFLNSSWGQTHRHIQGWTGKFSHLLPWERLNEILRRHRLEPPRLRLTRDGKSVASSSYLRHVTSGRRGSTPIPRLLAVELTTELRRGATLVLDAVDELYQPLEELAQGLERSFREHIQINAYAGWRTSRGFDLHWDDHDVFILQVAGRKRWSIYGMTRPFPLARDVLAAPKPEGAPPLWEGTLEDGDLLYIPRGWWHVALPLDEPTLHLTVGIHNRTGLDLLGWLRERLRGREDFRRDLPRFATRAERAAHINRLRAQLLEEWEGDLLDRFYQDSDATAAARPQLSLPWSATPEILPHGDALVRLTAPRGLDLRTSAPGEAQEVIEFSCHGKRWRFAPQSIVILRPLIEADVCSVNELCEAAKGKLEESTVRAFLGELILHGLVAIVVPDKSQR